MANLLRAAQAIKKGEQTSPPPSKRNRLDRYLWPECVIRATMSRRLSVTVEP